MAESHPYDADTKIEELLDKDHSILVGLLEEDDLYKKLLPLIDFFRRDVVKIDGSSSTSPGQTFCLKCHSGKKCRTTIGMIREKATLLLGETPEKPALFSLRKMLDDWITRPDSSYNEKTRMEGLRASDSKILWPLLDLTYKDIAESLQWTTRDIQECTDTKSNALTFLDTWRANEDNTTTIGMVIAKAEEIPTECSKLLEQLSKWIAQDEAITTGTETFSKQPIVPGTINDNRNIQPLDSEFETNEGDIDETELKNVHADTIPQQCQDDRCPEYKPSFGIDPLID